MTAIVTTHYLEEAEYANRVGMIQDGMLQALASPAELKRGALRGELLSLVCDRPIDAVEVLRNLPGVREAVLYGQTIHALIDPAAQSAEGLRIELLRAGIGVGSLAAVEPTLEDVFISLYSGFVISPDGSNVELEPARLRTIPLFDGFDEASLVAVANRFVTERQPAGAVLMQQGELGDRAYIIVNGSVDVLRREADGTERLVATLERGEVFGEIALVRDQPRTATVRTRVPCILLSLERQPFLELLEARPKLRAYVEQVALTRLEQLRAWP